MSVSNQWFEIISTYNDNMCQVYYCHTCEIFQHHLQDDIQCDTQREVSAYRWTEWQKQTIYSSN